MLYAITIGGNGLGGGWWVIDEVKVGGIDAARKFSTMAEALDLAERMQPTTSFELAPVRITTANAWEAGMTPEAS
jgi:L-alanine-DL-glutamate epimerase-like enolase superfamily enzyme